MLERTVALTPEEMCYGTGEEEGGGRVTSVVVRGAGDVSAVVGMGDTVEAEEGVDGGRGGGEGEGEDGGVGEDAGRGVLCVKCVVVHTIPE